ncbi:MAG: hypothetical protein NW205_09570 [Hyphomicrobiaceae bacterium]|nr:hypothetical protein [Hyphomicrobiaceae bacterium]
MRNTLMAMTLLAAVAGATPVLAAPGAGVLNALEHSTPASEVIQVHAGHWGCAWGPVPRWGGVRAYHRHVGRNRTPVACGKRWRGPGRPTLRGCFSIGPVWYCP